MKDIISKTLTFKYMFNMLNKVFKALGAGFPLGMKEKEKWKRGKKENGLPEPP